MSKQTGLAKWVSWMGLLKAAAVSIVSVGMALVTMTMHYDQYMNRLSALETMIQESRADRALLHQELKDHEKESVVEMKIFAKQVQDSADINNTAHAKIMVDLEGLKKDVTWLVNKGKLTRSE